MSAPMLVARLLLRGSEVWRDLCRRGARKSDVQSRRRHQGAKNWKPSSEIVHRAEETVRVVHVRGSWRRHSLWPTATTRAPRRSHTFDCGRRTKTRVRVLKQSRTFVSSGGARKTDEGGFLRSLAEVVMLLFPLT